MKLLFGRLSVGLTLVPFCLASLCLWAAVGVQEVPSGTQTPSAPSDFEAKIVDGRVLVRQKGSQRWEESSKLKQPVAIGLLDGNRKIYVVTKAIKFGKAKHTEDPVYPPSERKALNQGQVSMHVVVDEKGAVRLPTVDARPGPEFTKAAIEALPMGLRSGIFNLGGMNIRSAQFQRLCRTSTIPTM